MRAGRATVLLAVASTVLALAGAEIAVRILRPGLVAGPAAAGNPFWRHDAELGWFHRPGQKGTFSREEFTHHVSTNSMGFRDRERVPAAGPEGHFGATHLGCSEAQLLSAIVIKEIEPCPHTRAYESGRAYFPSGLP